MKLGTNNIGSVYLGTNAVQNVYLGTNLVYSAFSSGLLDTYTGAAAAYSLRRLSIAYTGSAIRVRRASDNSEQDIGFVGEYLNTSALTTFCSGTNGFVKTWYDQSGNGINFTQTAIASQPQIVSSGSVILENGKPSLQFDGVNDILQYTGLVYTTNTVFGTSVFTDNSSVGNAQILSQNSNDGVGRSALLSIDASSPRKSVYFFNNGTSYVNTSNGTIVNNAQTLMTNYSFSNNYYNALNGSSGNNLVSGQSFTPSSSLGTSIGGQPNLSILWFTGKIQEIVVWNSDQSTNKSGIETNINNYYSIY